MSLKDDAARLDWLDQQQGAGLISDDQGRWAVSSMGTQNLPEDDEPFDFVGTFWIEKAHWRNSIREAIDAAYAAREQEDSSA